MIVTLVIGSPQVKTPLWPTSTYVTVTVTPPCSVRTATPLASTSLTMARMRKFRCQPGCSRTLIAPSSFSRPGTRYAVLRAAGAELSVGVQAYRRVAAGGGGACPAEAHVSALAGATETATRGGAREVC